MQSTQALKDDRAVSPVIGVILMVAITVILAAVIGTFVLGLGDSLQNTGPNVQLSMEAGNSAQMVDLSHGGGEDLEFEDLTLLASGSEVNTLDNLGGSGTFSAGETLEGIDSGDAGTEVELSLRHDPSSQIIAKATLDLSS